MLMGVKMIGGRVLVLMRMPEGPMSVAVRVHEVGGK